MNVLVTVKKKVWKCIIFQATSPILPSEGLAQLQVFNTLNCPVHMKIDNNFEFDLRNLDMWAEKYLKANGETNLPYTADFTNCDLVSFPDVPENKIVNGTFCEREIIFPIGNIGHQ